MVTHGSGNFFCSLVLIINAGCFVVAGAWFWVHRFSFPLPVYNKDFAELLPLSAEFLVRILSDNRGIL